MPQLPSIAYLPMRFQLTAQTDCELREIKGSMLRGAFGHALKSTVCVNRQNTECRQCLLNQSCVFTQIFETLIHPPAPPNMKGVVTAPKPFIIDSFSTQTEFKAGETLTLDMTLLGSACKFYPYIIFSVLQMAEKGLGANRYPFVLKSVSILSPEQGAQQIYTVEDQTLKGSIKQFQPTVTTQLGNSTKLVFLTPTRLKFRGQYTMQFNFRWLMMRMLQRVMELAYFYHQAEQAYWDYSEWMDLAAQVEIDKPHLVWHDWQRYSNRQQAKMNMGGFIGDVTVSGNLEPFTELFALCEILHIGKGTSFGLGKINFQQVS